jgi:hypothetical protein
MTGPSTSDVLPGLELARRFYQQAVKPRLAGTPHAAALLGDGSEVLGYDDEVSTDHDFGPRVQVLLPPGTDPEPVQAALPGEAYVTTVDTFFRDRLGVDPASGMRLADWLLAPTQRLATLTGGAVLHDPDGALARRREALAWYPDDVWRYVLAAGWLRIGEEEAFVGRTGSTGDDLGSRVLAARLARDLVRLAFLVERRWAPYSKWLGRAFADLPLAATLGSPLAAALAAPGWREREAALCTAASLLGAATNQLGLAEPVDSTPRRYYTRDIRVIGAGRFTKALTAAITDTEVRALLDRLGGTPGAIDQVVDSVEILTHPDRCEAAAALLAKRGSG